MANQEHYSLRWNNHQTHILRAFDSLLQTKTLVDVTLVCAETSIRAHKVVLSACSPFFQRVFSETPCKHPVIVLKDFRGWVVQAIVDFMYRGEISVPQERLQTLIQAGESLQVRGLVDHPVAGNTPTPAQSLDDFGLLDDDSMDATHFNETTSLLNSTTKLLQPHVYNIDSSTTPNIDNQTPDICTSPMPRRKQARPRRRSGDCNPQDLSSKPGSPTPPVSISNSTTETPTTPLSSGTTTSSSVKSDRGRNQHKMDRTKFRERDHSDITPNSDIKPKKEKLDEDDNDKSEKASSDNNQAKRSSSSLNIDDEDGDNENCDGDEEEETTAEGPENLCTKSNSNKNNNNNSSNDNKNRIVLSLKDIRHLNRSSSSLAQHRIPSSHHSNNNHHHSHHHHQHNLPPPSHHSHQTSTSSSHHHSHPLNLNSHHSSMKMESSEEAAAREMLGGRDSPFLDHMDLQALAHHNLLHGGHAIEHLAGLSNKDFKDFTSSSPMSLPNHFGQQDGHHTNSPLNFPHMSSVSSLTLTPPHMFGLDSPLGLFPPGMDPSKLYSPLMEMSDPRSLHQDSTPFLKKKMNRPKGQHSAPRGGPPRSWTNAELTEALQHVWNKKMTTSQASRIFGIPYNSLLMYVRGKYGKSLKLEQLRKDCISGPPIEMLTMGMSGHNNNNKGSSHNQNKDMKDDNMPRSASSEPDLMSSPNMFNPFPPGFYPDFASGFPGLPLSVLNLLPPDRQLQHHAMQMDEDCKSDRSKQSSMDDDFQQPLALNRDDKRDLLLQNGIERD